MTTKVKSIEAAPDFTLVDITGRSVGLAQFQGKKHVVLVFNRGLL